MAIKIDFSDKTVIITGAMRGIGKAITEQLKDSRATLILTGTDKNKLDALNRSLKDKKNIRYFYLDFLNEESITQFLSKVKGYKKIDVCINNAGINRINYVCDTPTKDWDEIIRVNLRGPFLLTKGIGKMMQSRNYGRIVNIASIFGVITKEKRAAYTATKAGLIGFTKTAAVDLAPYNILVNSVSPGFILTDLTKKILSIKEIESLKSLIPLGRLGTPEDVAPLVAFLASGLNTYITGQNIIVDGGYVNI